MATKKATPAKKAATRKKGGRPSKYTPDLVEAICARLSKGEPLAVICRDEGMPHPNTVRNWMEADPAVSVAIARAREDGEDAIAADCLEIADDGRNDWMDRKAGEGDEKALQFNGENVQRSRLRVDTRLKLLAKWNPKKWGDRIAQELSGPGGSPIQTEDVTQRDADEFARRIARLAAAGSAGSGTGEAVGEGKG